MPTTSTCFSCPGDKPPVLPGRTTSACFSYATHWTPPPRQMPANSTCFSYMPRISSASRAGVVSPCFSYATDVPALRGGTNSACFSY